MVLPDSYRVEWAESLPPEEARRLGGPPLANMAGFAAFSTKKTQLLFAEVLRGDRRVCLAPVVRLRRRKATDMLRQPLRRWLGLLFGPLAYKTTLLLDTAFMAYHAGSPFCCEEGVDREGVKRAVAAFLKKQRRTDTVWITEPEGESAWAEEAGFDRFRTLPMVHVDVTGCGSLDDYTARLSKKRRRNCRTERERFESAGATIEFVEGPFDGDVAEEMLGCLAASAEKSTLTVPYNDVLTHPDAFRAQQQFGLVARLDGKMIGFMSFIESGGLLMQCHGGLDYIRSTEVQAYHNLIYAAIGLAIERGCDRLSMGPLNNETKRRAGTDLLPMAACLWNKNPVDTLVARKLFIRNFQVYSGEV
ncbi:MAG: GNAT family N-acetyltransferase [Planctomycetota bacterium]